jgi:large-conductance mechanosensitive channel
MNEESVINMSSVITALIGIVIVAFIALILYRRYNIKRKVSEQKTETGSSNLKYTLVKKSDKSKSAQ